MPLDSQSKCPVSKLKSIFSPILNLVEKVRWATNHSLIVTNNPYTSQFWKKYLWLQNTKLNVNKITSEFNVDDLYEKMETDWPTALYEYWGENFQLLKNWCESGLSIGITKQLIQGWKCINTQLPEELIESSLQEVLQYLHSTIDLGFYDIAIEYIQTLKERWEWSIILQETKFLYLCIAFSELSWEEWLSKDMMEIIFESWISTTVLNIIEAIYLKLVSWGWTLSDLWGLIKENKAYWNWHWTTNIPTNYYMQWLWNRIVSWTRSVKTEETDNYNIWDFEPNSIKITHSFSEKEFTGFVKKLRKQFSKLWVGSTYVWCPLLYERDEETNTNLIIAYNEVILQLFLNWLNEYYWELENEDTI